MIELAETFRDQGRPNEVFNMLSPFVDSEEPTDSEKIGIRITRSNISPSLINPLMKVQTEFG